MTGPLLLPVKDQQLFTKNINKHRQKTVREHTFALTADLSSLLDFNLIIGFFRADLTLSESPWNIVCYTN